MDNYANLFITLRGFIIISLNLFKKTGNFHNLAIPILVPGALFPDLRRANIFLTDSKT